MAPVELTPATIRREGGLHRITIAGAAAGVERTKTGAVSALCRYAIEKNESLIVTVITGDGKAYLSISPRGEVAPSTPPAPSSVRPDVSAGTVRRDLGHSDDADDDTQSWVEERLLERPTATEPPRRRGRLFRRRQ